MITKSLPILLVLWMLPVVSCGEMDSKISVIGPETLPLTYKHPTPTVYIETANQAHCGGVYVDDGVVLTAKHCLREPIDMSIRFPLLSSIAVLDTKGLHNLDLGLLYFDPLELINTAQNHPAYLLPAPARIAATLHAPVEVVVEGFGGASHHHQPKLHMRRGHLMLYPNHRLNLFLQTKTARQKLGLHWLNPGRLAFYVQRALDPAARPINVGGFGSIAYSTPKTLSKISSIREEGSMLCDGDSGSPAYQIQDGQYELVAILSSTFSAQSPLSLLKESLFPKEKTSSKDCSASGLFYVVAGSSSSSLPPLKNYKNYKNTNKLHNPHYEYNFEK